MSNKVFIPDVENATLPDLIYFSRTRKIWLGLTTNQKQRVHDLINAKSGQHG